MMMIMMQKVFHRKVLAQFDLAALLVVQVQQMVGCYIIWLEGSLDLRKRIHDEGASLAVQIGWGDGKYSFSTIKCI